jgi:TP901 family phage tail tape measure protein
VKLADYQILVKVVLDKTNLQPELDKLGEQISRKVSEKSAKGKPIKVPIDVDLDDAKIQARINKIIKDVNKSGGPKKESFFDTSGEMNRVVETYNGNLGEAVTITRTLVAETEEMEAHWVDSVKYVNATKDQAEGLRKVQAEDYEITKKQEELKRRIFGENYTVTKKQEEEKRKLLSENYAVTQKQEELKRKLLAENYAVTQKQEELKRKLLAENYAATVKQEETKRKLLAENAAYDIKVAQNKAKLLDQYTNKLTVLQAKNKEAFANVDVQNSLKQFQAQFSAFDGTTKSTANLNKAWGDLNTSVQKTNASMVVVNKNGMNLVSMFELAAKKVIIWAGATTLLYGSLQELRKAVQYIKDLNKEMTAIQIVSNATDEEIRALAKDYNQLAKEVGATTVEVAKGSVEWIRQGRSLSETTTLLKNSMMLSKLAGMESSEATTLLTSTMAGFKMSVDDVLPALDKLIAVDNAFATSSQEVATALQYSAAVANQAGVSYDQLVAYITTVSSVTRMSAETIGQSFKTMFTRMEQIKVGKLFEDDTTSINQVATSLHAVGVEMMTDANTFRPMGDVLTDLADKWDTLTQKQQNAIAGTIAGIRQVPQFLTLMQNWAMVTKAEGIEMDSAGLATERYRIYLKGLEAAVNKFTVAWEKLVMDTTNSGTIRFFIELGTALLGLVDSIGLFNIAIIALGSYLGAKLLVYIPYITSAIMNLAGAEGVATLATTTLSSALTGGLIGIAIVGAIYAFNALSTSVEKTYNEFEKLKSVADKNQDELRDLAKEYESLASKQNKSAEDITRLLDIQTILNTKYNASKEGINAYSDAIDLNSEAIQKNIDWMIKQATVQAENFIAVNTGKYNEAKDYLNNPNVKPGSPVFGLKPVEQIKWLDEQIAKGKDTLGLYRGIRDTIVEETNAAQKLIIEYEHYGNVLEGTNKTLEKSGELVENIEVPLTLTQLQEALDKQASSLSGLSEEMSKLMSDYEEYGQLGLEQVEQLKTAFPEEYTQALYIENGQIKLNVEELKKLVLAKYDAAYATATEAFASSLAVDAFSEETKALREQMLVYQALRDQAANGTLFSPDTIKDQTKAIEDQQKAYQDLLKDTIDMIKQEKEAEKQALQEELEAFRKRIEEEKRLIDERADAQKQHLQDELDGYEKIIDAEKDLLDAKQREADFQDELAEKNKSLSDIEAELLELQFDNSEEANAKRLQLEEEKATKVKEISKLQADNTLQNEKDALDKELEKFQNIIEKKQKAIETAAKKQKSLLDKELREFEASNLARQKSIEQYLKKTGQLNADAMALLNQRSTAFYNKLLEWNKIYGTSIQNDIINKWKTAFDVLQSYQMGANQAVLTAAQKTAQTHVFQTKFHEGGIVGGLPTLPETETYAKLVRGEVVVTEGQAFSFLQSTLPKLFSVANKGGGNINVPIEITVMGNLDKTVLPDLKETILSTLNEAMRSRGIRRDAFSYSV